MGTTYSEIQRRVLLGFPKVDGESLLVIKQSINDAIQAIAGLKEASSLLKTDTTSAVTEADTKSYHRVTGLNLTRPKDIKSIRLIDGGLSRKLIYVDPVNLDERIPYPEQNSTTRPKWYTEYGDYIEFIPIPDDTYTLYVRYSQWPVALSEDADQSPYGTEWDHVIVFLSKDIANAYLNGEYVSVNQKAVDYLHSSKKADESKSDHVIIAQPFDPTGCNKGALNNYYEDPFIKGVK